jgi:hypothetical protein
MSTIDFEKDFETIKILVESNTETGRTDAFIISYTKTEKQVRRIFTNLVYQFPAFDITHYDAILGIIASKRRLYFENFIHGFDTIYPKSFKVIVGEPTYKQFLNTDFSRIKKYRNKILHGQPTGEQLSADDLRQEITIMRNWCSIVAESMNKEIGFDGFQRNSFRKNANKNLAVNYKVKITDLTSLDNFIENNMNRR